MSTYVASLKMTMFDGVTPSYKKMTTAAEIFSNTQRKVANGFNSVMNIGKGVFVGNTISSGFNLAKNSIADAGNQWVQFDKETRMATSRWEDVTSGATSYSEALKTTKETTLAVQSATKFTAAEVAYAMNNMAASGYTLQQANRETMMSIGKFATIADTDIATATAGLTGSMAAWNEPFANANRHAAEMAVAANASRMSIIDLAEATKVSGSAYSAFGMKSRGFYEMLMALSKVEIRGSEAGTRARGIISSMLRPQTIKELKSLGKGISIADSFGNLRDPLEIIADIRKELSGMGTAQKGVKLKKMFEQQDLAAAATLLNVNDAEWFRISNSFNDATGKMEKQFLEANNTIVNKWALMKSAFTSKFIIGAEAGQSPIVALIEMVTQKIQSFDPAKMTAFIEKELPVYITTTVSAFKELGMVLREYLPMVKSLYETFRPLLPILPALIGLFLKLFIISKFIAVGYKIGTVIGFIGSKIAALGVFLSSTGSILANLMIALGFGGTAATLPWVVAAVAGIGILINTFLTLKELWEKLSYGFNNEGFKFSELFKLYGETLVDYWLRPLDLIILAFQKIGLISSDNYNIWNKMRNGMDTPAVTNNTPYVPMSKTVGLNSQFVPSIAGSTYKATEQNPYSPVKGFPYPGASENRERSVLPENKPINLYAPEGLRLPAMSRVSFDVNILSDRFTAKADVKQESGAPVAYKISNNMGVN